MQIKGYEDAVLYYEPEQERAVTRRGTILIFPGGGYSWLSDREALPILHAFRAQGYRAAILYYEVKAEILGLRPLRQAAWAVAKLRELFPGEPVFVNGYSAGGHCAASLAVHWDDTDWNGNPLFSELEAFISEERSGSSSLSPVSPSSSAEKAVLSARRFRPDAMLLCYPVLSSGSYAHRDSFIRLLGSRERFLSLYGDAGEYDRALRWMSLETQLHATTPPAFLWHTAEDRSVPAENSLHFASAMVSLGLPVELQLYPFGVHGLSLATPELSEAEKRRVEDPHVAGWFSRALEWLQYLEARGYFQEKSPQSSTKS